jgi:two-component system invasion response regulator UvrY
MGVRVFHCDDSPAFTSLARLWLAEHPEIEHVGVAHTRQQAVAAAAAADPDVVLIDTMGEPRDPGLLRELRRVAPRARIIVYSRYVGMLESDELPANADGYLSKTDDERLLLELVFRLGSTARLESIGARGARAPSGTSGWVRARKTSAR